MGVLTAPLAGAYFLGFLGVIRTCRKSPMISSRKVNIILFYQTHRHVRLLSHGLLIAANSSRSQAGWSSGNGIAA